MPAPQVGVGVLILRDGKVLLGRRKGSHGAGCWSAPGGHLEFGEAVEDCALREALEETGLALSELRHGPFSNDVFEGRHYLTAFILAGCAEDAEARLMEPDKCDGWAWFDWADLPEPLFARPGEPAPAGLFALRPEALSDRQKKSRPRGSWSGNTLGVRTHREHRPVRNGIKRSLFELLGPFGGRSTVVTSARRRAKGLPACVAVSRTASAAAARPSPAGHRRPGGCVRRASTVPAGTSGRSARHWPPR